ncbi:NAD(P)-binding domain-containing protein [Kibdelosporangium aridum]|uniref:3-hydroxyisobutyrate dehydrogenase n=1 Tax=Kibdelosporangium aridum TaxID=2030 RepID=A0A1W2EWB3_KIBAR|nr:NAD(P)-binding domain-containing protein [Kibdelosporangium aridum]SMD13954.1 3-hydroxyisobutyrate dehydrogenase [Kibdelosporangium aridum]
MSKQSVTVIGLGAMGKTLAKTFVRNGHPTTVWNRTPGKVVEGATHAPTAAEAVSASEVVVVCVLDDKAAREVLDPVDLTGKAVVNLTNGTPAHAREFARGDYLDGGIMAVPQMIGTPEVIVLYSGSQKVFDNYQDTLNALGRSKFVGDDPGLAALYDLALLSAMYGQFAGAQHALAMVGANKGDFVESLLIPWLTSTMFAIPTLGQSDPQSPDDMQAVAIANIIQASEDLGLGQPGHLR